MRSHNGTLTAVIELDVSEDILTERVQGRLIHPSSGRTYHSLSNPPKSFMKDDITGEPLIQRDDDKAKTFRKRFEVYRQQTQPLSDFYLARGTLKKVDASADIETIFRTIEAMLQSL